MTLKILYLFVDLILPLVAGYALGRSGRLKREALDRLMTWTIWAVAPVVGALSFWTISLRMELIWLPVLGVLMQAVPGCLGYLWARARYEDRLDRGGYLLAAALSNRRVVGGLSLFILYGERGYAWSQLVLLLGPPAVYLIFFPIARYLHDAHHGQTEGGTSLRSLLLNRNQLPLAGIAAGLTLNALNIPRPAPLGVLFTAGVHTIAWLLLVPVGFSIRFQRMHGYWGQVCSLLGLKFLLTPLVVGPLAWALGLRGPVLMTVVLLSAAPTAVFAVVTAKLHRLNVDLVNAAFVLTTAVYLLIIFPAILGVVLLAG